MRVDFVTIFPGLISGALEYGIVHQSVEKRLVEIGVRDLRDYTKDRHRTVDDIPYGGGPGMVFKPEPLSEALNAIRVPGSLTIMPGPQGSKFDRDAARDLAAFQHLIFVCGRYEGIDERAMEMIDREYSIGDFVSMGGELPALLMLEAILRFVRDVVKEVGSVETDSFEESLLDYPHFTRPAEFRGNKVPDVLLSGNHEQIRLWRRKMRLQRTKERRPDLLAKAQLTDEDRKLLAEIEKEKS
jgi:tRNA (guanine37-N1)-methyltransferase